MKAAEDSRTPKRCRAHPCARQREAFWSAAVSAAFRRIGKLCNERMTTQGEFTFGAEGPDQGYVQWLTGRKMAVEELARRINLPLGHEVEVWLYGGIRLRGRLRLQEEVLFIEEERVRHLELLVDRVPFAYREMESCVRVD
jgi:hypothetical protein